MSRVTRNNFSHNTYKNRVARDANEKVVTYFRAVEYEYCISIETMESIDYLDKSGQYKLYCRLRLLSVYVFKFQQHTVTVKELWIAPPRGVPSGTDSYSLQYSACA